MIALALIWFFWFSPFFRIKSVKVIGNERILSSDVESIVWEQTRSKRYLAGPQNNLFLFHKQKFIDLMSDKYFFEEISVNKELPGSVVISVKEEKPVAFWQENGQYYIIDGLGRVLFPSALMEVEQGVFPLVENRGNVAISGRKTALDEELLGKILLIDGIFKDDKKFLFQIERFIFDAEANTIKADLRDGPIIYFNPADDLGKQYSKMAVLIEESLGDDFHKKNYLDLRYGERVYYQ